MLREASIHNGLAALRTRWPPGWLNGNPLWARWQQAKARRARVVNPTRPSQRFYLYMGTISAAGLIVLLNAVAYAWQQPDVLAWALILGGGTVVTNFLPIRDQRRHTRYDLMPALLFAGALTLPPATLPLVSISGQIPYAVWRKPRMRFLEPMFNYTQSTLAAQAAALVYRILGGDSYIVDSAGDLAAVLGAMLVFLVVQQALVTGAVMAYRNIGWREAGLFEFGNSLIDLLILSIGSVIALMYYVSLWALMVSAAPLAGLYLALRLSQDRESLKEADKAKSELVANVSHELRAPLASIKLYTEMLQCNVDDGDISIRTEFCKVIDRKTERLAELITDLLELSRLESGRIQPRLEPLSLSEIVDHVIASLAAQTQARQLTMANNIRPKALLVLASQDLLHTALRNICSNAIKFNRPGGRVDIDARVEKDLVAISICDTGIGIPSEALPHIFDKFFRVQSSTESGIEGSGLGLTVARAAIEMQGGRIDASSTLGQGSCFTIRLPHKQVEAD